ncbi:MAG TPA: phage baseplate protein [Chloroflexia bacterium]
MQQPPARRALLLLGAACPDLTPGALEELPIGRRDARLLTLREWTFGPRLVSLAQCPRCGERLELDFSVSDIRAPGADEEQPPQELLLDSEGYEVRFRLPDSRDLLALADEGPPEQEGEGDAHLGEAQRFVLARCVAAATHNGEDVPAGDLPRSVIEAVAACMAQADPQGSVRLDLECVACGHKWDIGFDIVSFFWAEIHAWAYRLLREIHVLATAYGWHEADILAMHPARRELYLQMVGK